MPTIKHYWRALLDWGDWGQRQLDRLYRQSWARQLMRFGHGAKGFLYGMIGLFAVRAVFYDGQPAGGSDIVLRTLDDRGIGSFLLGVLSIGLAGYAFWRFVQVLLDPENPPYKATLQQVVQRCGYGFSGLTYLGIGYTAGRLAIGLTVDFKDTVEEVAEAFYETTIGPWAFLASGVGVILIGCIYIYGAYSGDFISHFRPRLDDEVKRLTVIVGKIGFTARGVSFILIGAYLMKSAYFLNGDTAGGLGKVLDRLDDQRFGKIWLTGIAFGFLAYASYMFMAAFYREFPTSPHLQPRSRPQPRPNRIQK